MANYKDALLKLREEISELGIELGGEEACHDKDGDLLPIMSKLIGELIDPMADNSLINLIKEQVDDEPDEDYLDQESFERCAVRAVKIMDDTIESIQRNQKLQSEANKNEKHSVRSSTLAILSSGLAPGASKELTEILQNARSELSEQIDKIYNSVKEQEAAEKVSGEEFYRVYEKFIGSTESRVSDKEDHVKPSEPPSPAASTDVSDNESSRASSPAKLESSDDEDSSHKKRI